MDKCDGNGIHEIITGQTKGYCDAIKKKLPSEWEKLIGVDILDPDGWKFEHGDGDYKPKNFDVPIDRVEFLFRASWSTVQYKAKIKTGGINEENILRDLIGKCNCLTKTPEPQYHDKTCPVYLYYEVIKLQKRNEIYQNCVNSLDDFFEYRYKSFGVESIKNEVHSCLNELTEKLRGLYNDGKNM